MTERERIDKAKRRLLHSLSIIKMQASEHWHILRSFQTITPQFNASLKL